MTRSKITALTVALLTLSFFMLKPPDTLAASACGFDPTEVSPGGTLGVIVTDLPGINTVRLYSPGSPTITLGTVNGGVGVPSTGGNTFTLPLSTTAPEYQVRVETPFVGEITCGPGNLTVTGAGVGCSFSPPSVSIGDSLTINVTDLPGSNIARLYTFGSPTITLGNVSGSPGIPSFGANTFTIPSSATAPEYQVRVETTFVGEITCGNLTVTDDGDGDGSGGTVECDSFLDCISGFDNPSDIEGSTFVGDFVTRLLPLAIAFGGFLSVIMIVISGIQFTSSSGNPEGAAAARGRLTFAIIGFVLLTLAYIITRVIDVVFLRGSGVF